MLLSTDASIREQHLAVRSHVGWYDFTHRLVEVKAGKGDTPKGILLREGR